MTVRPDSGLKIFASRFFRPQSSEFEPRRKNGSLRIGTSTWKSLASLSSFSGIGNLSSGLEIAECSTQAVGNAYRNPRRRSSRIPRRAAYVADDGVRSPARGEADAPSDVDLIVVAPSTRPFVDPFRDYPQLLRSPVGIDLLVYTPDEFGRERRWNRLCATPSVKRAGWCSEIVGVVG